ncbi:MAG TPA: hypothetical protein VKB55_15690 [Nocardioidaceae bacterium]|nr:hypothetical protein [Nocardioidaceae bacterium]
MQISRQEISLTRRRAMEHRIAANLLRHEADAERRTGDVNRADEGIRRAEANDLRVRTARLRRGVRASGNVDEDERERLADLREREADERERLADLREAAADARDRRANRRQRTADRRDREADRRDRIADGRDLAADGRDQDELRRLACERRRRPEVLTLAARAEGP